MIVAVAELVGVQDAPTRSSPDIAGQMLAEGVVRVPAVHTKVKKTIRRSDRTYSFNSGPSRAILFELPELQGRYRVTVASLCNCGGPLKSVLLPRVDFLDARLNLLRTLEANDFPRPSENMFSGYQGAYKTTVDGEEGASRIRYVLVYTIPENVGKRFGILTIAEGVIRKTTFPYFAAEHGTIEIEVSKE
jgi:hypothetical protein